jgi:hypothetical protein
MGFSLKFTAPTTRKNFILNAIKIAGRLLNQQSSFCSR